MSNSLFYTELQKYFRLLAGMNALVDNAGWDDLVTDVRRASFVTQKGSYDSVVRFSKVSQEAVDPSIFTYLEANQNKIKDISLIDNLANEVESKITELIETGFPIEIIETWLQKAVKLSRIKITKDSRILLPDYNKEIKMNQMPKTLFLWFLKHQEGCRVKELINHKEELLAIYRRLSVRDDEAQVLSSIDALVNAYGNSFSEKCAAVKRAFLKEIPNRIAMNYYIQGPQGGIKGISLDREMVEWDE